MALISLVDNGHNLGGIDDVSRWPWTWHRLIAYCRTVKHIYEMAALDEDKESALPPRWMWFEGDEVENWFEERRQAHKEQKELLP